MRIRLLFFGLARDLAGTAEETTDLSEGERLEDAWTRTLASFPRLHEISGSILMAVNQSVAPPSRVLRDGDEVAFLPPVSGGEERDFCRLTRGEISASALIEGLKDPGNGALVTFEGIVRNHSSGRSTLYLEYEAYSPMAVREMEAIASEAKSKFMIDGIRIIHRTGRLDIGETSVAIAVMSAHRAAAFEACRYAIDELKRRVPIWKKEYFTDGAAWADGETRARAGSEPHTARQVEGRAVTQIMASKPR